MGSATVKRPLMPVFPDRDKKNMITITAPISGCSITGSVPPYPLTTHGWMILQVRVPSYGTWRVLNAPAITFKGRIIWETAAGRRFGVTRIANTTNADPFQPVAQSFEPPAGVVLHLTGIVGPSGYFAGEPFTFTLATDMVAPAVYQPGAPSVSSFAIGSYLGNDSSVVIGP